MPNMRRQARRARPDGPFLGRRQPTERSPFPLAIRRPPFPRWVHPARSRTMSRTLQRVRSEVEKNCDYVGLGFADQARKIYRGESERRGIYGRPTPEQAGSALPTRESRSLAFLGSVGGGLEQIRSLWFVSAGGEVVGALFGRELRQGVADGVPEIRMVRAAALRRSALSLANAFSIGLKSGE